MWISLLCRQCEVLVLLQTVVERCLNKGLGLSEWGGGVLHKNGGNCGMVLCYGNLFYFYRLLKSEKEESDQVESLPLNARGPKPLSPCPFSPLYAAAD